jgi:hypothetical protein
MFICWVTLAHTAVRRKVSAVCYEDYWNQWAKDAHIKDRWKVWRHVASLGWKGLKALILHFMKGKCPDKMFRCFADRASQYNPSKWPTWCTNSLFYNKFTTVLYMFREPLCSSSGGKIVLIQHLVSSPSVSDRPVHRLKEFSLNLCTNWSFTESDDTRCCINTIWPPDDEHNAARNM